MKEFKSFYKKVKGNEGKRCYYPDRLDTYGCGCQHDCSYCYAKSLLSFRNLWNSQEPSIADFKKVKKIIPKLTNVIRLGGMTDCFQPAEQKNKVTYQVLQELNKHKKPYLIVTKSDLVATDEYIKVLDKDLAHIQISVTTTSDKLSSKMEKATNPANRIKAIEKLTALGYDVALRLSPFIPELYDFQVLNKIKCNKVIVEFLRVNHWIKKWFDISYEDYTLKEGGYNHLPLYLKQNYLKRIQFKNISVCEDVNEHYNYFKHYYNPNSEDCCNLKKEI